MIAFSSSLEEWIDKSSQSYLSLHRDEQGRRRKSSSIADVNSVHMVFVCWLTKSMTCMYVYISIYLDIHPMNFTFESHRRLLLPQQRIYTFIVGEEHEIRSMTSQVFFSSSFCFRYVHIGRYCLTDHKYRCPCSFEQVNE